MGGHFKNIFASFIFVLAFVNIGCASTFANSYLEVSEVDVYSPSGAPDGLSGLAYAGGNRYLAVDDHGGRLFELFIDTNPETGKIKGFKLGSCTVLKGGVDLESLAYDSKTGELWVSDERKQFIREYNSSGEPLREAPVDDIFKKTRYLMGFESLAMNSEATELWTANEEALRVDGALASRTNGSLVRLVKYVRQSTNENWNVGAMYPYFTDPLAGANFRGVQRSGLTDMCVLDDGSLLVLEREFSRVGLVPRFRLRLYRVVVDGATDVKDLKGLIGKEYVVASKELLYETKGFAMYEGMALGPKLSDGSRLMLVVSDANEGGLIRFLSLKIYTKKP